jgi:Zn-dependent oligopeptidase
MDVKLLDGLSDKYKKALSENSPVPNKKGFVFLNVGKKSSGLVASMDNSEARKIFSHASTNINKENRPIYDQLNLKRYEQSKILNYTSYSERVIEGMMAKNISNVEKLLNDLTLRISKQGSIEMDKIIQYKQKLT